MWGPGSFPLDRVVRQTFASTPVSTPIVSTPIVSIPRADVSSKNDSCPDSTIPEAIIEAARAAFPKGNRYIEIRDTLGTVYTNVDFADLYSADLFSHPGQPAHDHARSHDIGRCA